MSHRILWHPRNSSTGCMSSPCYRPRGSTPGGTAIAMCRSPASPRAFPDVSPRESHGGFIGQTSSSSMYPAAELNPWSRPIQQGQRVDFDVALPELGRAPHVVAQTGFVSHDVRRSAVFLQEPGAQIDPSITSCGNSACPFDQAEEQAVAAYDEAAIMARISCLIQSHRGRFYQSQEPEASPPPVFSHTVVESGGPSESNTRNPAARRPWGLSLVISVSMTRWQAATPWR